MFEVTHLIFRHGYFDVFLLVPRYLQGTSAGAAVGSRQDQGTSLCRAPARQQVIQERGTARANERVERRHREYPELVQRLLRHPAHVGQKAL